MIHSMALAPPRPSQDESPRQSEGPGSFRRRALCLPRPRPRPLRRGRGLSSDLRWSPRAFPEWIRGGRLDPHPGTRERAAPAASRWSACARCSAAPGRAPRERPLLPAASLLEVPDRRRREAMPSELSHPSQASGPALSRRQAPPVRLPSGFSGPPGCPRRTGERTHCHAYIVQLSPYCKGHREQTP